MTFRIALGLTALMSVGCGSIANDKGNHSGIPDPGASEYPDDPTIAQPPGSEVPPVECPGSGVVSGDWELDIEDGGYNDAVVQAIALTPSGSIYVAGYSGESLGALDTEASLNNSYFVARFGADGALHWARRYVFGSVGLLSDDHEGVFVSGTMTGTFEESHSTLLEHVDCHGESLAKLDTPNATIGSPSLALRNDGKLIVAGQYNGDLGIGGTTSNLAFAVFIAELGADGSHGWVHTYEHSIEGVVRIATASNGDAILAGSAKATTAFGLPANPSPGPGEPFPPYPQPKTHVVRYDSAGNTVYAKRLHGEGFDTVGSLAIDASDRVFIGMGVDYAGGSAAQIARVEPDGQTFSTMELGIGSDSIEVTDGFLEGELLYASAIVPKDAEFGSGPVPEWGSLELVFDTTSSTLVSATPIGPPMGKVYAIAHTPTGKRIVAGAMPYAFGSDATIGGFVSVK